MARHSRWINFATTGDPKPAAGLRHLTDQVTLYVIPGSAGQWMPAVHSGTTGALERLPLTATVDEARNAAELAGQRASRALAAANPAGLDEIVTDLAGSADYTRADLTALIAHRLDDPDRQRLDDPSPTELVEILGHAGLTPAATVAVLHAEEAAADSVAPLLATIGIPMPDAIDILRTRWDLTGVEAATSLGATAADMRAAGCTSTDVMATHPTDSLQDLCDDPHQWELAAGTMAGAGLRPHVVAAHLVAHAPSLNAFATALTVGIDDADHGLTTAARVGATGDQLAAASEAYGLSPIQAAAALYDAGIAPDVVLDTLDARCDHDTDTTVGIAQGLGIGGDTIGAWQHPSMVAAVTSIGDRDDAEALLALLPPPGPSAETDPIRLLNTLPALESPVVESTHP